MRPKLVIDESVDFNVLRALRNLGWDILSILEEYRGVKDPQVLDIGISNRAIVITEDKDFGEWVFAHKVKTSVILLRYPPQEIDNIIESLHSVLEKYGEELRDKFVVITPRKLRIRNI